MHIIGLGLNHRTAPIEVREKVSFTKEEIIPALSALKDYIGEGVILSTCNRTEIYTIASDVASTNASINAFLSNHNSLEDSFLLPFLYTFQDAEAAHHLFRVAAGLDSMILGESQILGQVRDALAFSDKAGALGDPLARLFHYAIGAGRRVREETDIGRHSLSVSYAGVQLARQALGELRGLQVLLIGAGEAGQLVSKALRTIGVGEVIVANRTASRGKELARELMGRAVDFGALEEALTTCDIVVASTDSPEYIIREGMVREAMSSRDFRPILIVDLAMPRDVEQAIAQIEGVRLYNIDDLHAIAEVNRSQREMSASEAEIIVSEEVERFMAWWRSLEAVPLIKALRRQAESVRRRELDKAMRRMPDLSPESRDLLERMTRSIVEKLLHSPIVALKERRSASHLQVAQEIFRLGDKSD